MDNPPRHPRRRRIALWIIGCFAVIVALVFFAARPSAILGVDGSALESSVGGSSLGLVSTVPCRHLGGSVWGCGRHDEQFSGTVSYRVTVDGLGCWSATRTGSPGEGSHKHLSGCVTILDYVFG